jgi:hypothetical protein
MLRVVKLNVAILNVIMLSVIVLRVVKLNVVILNAFMVSVVVPTNALICRANTMPASVCIQEYRLSLW